MADEHTDGHEPAQETQSGPKREASETPYIGFVGSFSHSIDAKGRMIIPASFREALGARFAVAPTPDYQAVALYPIADWIARRDELAALVRRKPMAQPFLDMFTKYSYTDCEADAQGRLLIPQRIRAWRLGDTRDVDVDGAYNHIKIVPAAKGMDQDRLFDEKFADPLAALTELQKDLF